MISVCEKTTVTQGGTTAGSCGQNVTNTNFLTTDGYDPLDNLTAVTQNAQPLDGGSQSRSYSFDQFSRLTGPGAFIASSSGGLTGSVRGLPISPSTKGNSTAFGVSFGGGYLSGASGGLNATNHTKPLQLPKFSGFSFIDYILYAVTQVCK